MFFNLVEHKIRFFTNKQEFLTLLHLRSFRQLQNFSEEKWIHATENSIELGFVAFLGNKSKNIRVFNDCEVLIENSVTRVTVRLHEACRVIPKSYPSDGIFNL